MTSSTDALGNTVLYSYNADTGILEWTQGPEQTEDTRTEYTYDLVTYLLETVESTTDTGLNMSVDYTYDTENLLTKLQTPTTAYQFAYGDFNLRHNVKIGSRELAKYTYDEKNYSLKKLDYGNGDYVQYEYDDYGRLLLETYENQETVSYQYDNDGVLVAFTDSASGITTRQYFDLSGRTVGYSEIGADFTHTVGYEYDNINNLTQLVESIGDSEKTTSYAYDDDNRVTSVTTDGTTVEYSYDEFGRVSQQVTKNGDTVILTEYFTFTEPSDTATSGQVATYRTVSAGMDVTYSYTYDKNGNILTASNGTYLTTYTYDSANQLIREDNQRKGKSYTWTYDNAGNILSLETYDYTTGELNGEPDVVTYSYDKKTDATDTDYWGDLLISYADTAVTYEYQEATEVLQKDGTTKTCYNIGNPTQLNGRSYTWEHGRQLATLTENNTTWNYTYNNAGLRTGRYVVNGASYKYIYNGSQLVQMTVNGQKVTFTYDASGTPLTMKVGNTTYYYITNLQGDVMGLMDSTGNLVVSYEYSAYGVRTVTLGDGTTAENLNPLTYRGYVYDSETGLYYLQSRYYDPVVGRFINADGLVATGQGLTGNNMFAYCGNNPVNRADPSGQFFSSTLQSALQLAKDIPYAINVAIFEFIFGKLDYDNLKDLDINTEDYHNYDCLGNAVMKAFDYTCPGYYYDGSTYFAYYGLKHIVGSENIRILSSIDAPISPDEYRVAIKCGYSDYHYIRQDETGWYNKSGTLLGSYVPEDFVAADVWYPVRGLSDGGYEILDYVGIIYDSETIYVAIKKGWDEE